MSLRPLLCGSHRMCAAGLVAGRVRRAAPARSGPVRRRSLGSGRCRGATSSTARGSRPDEIALGLRPWRRRLGQPGAADLHRSPQNAVVARRRARDHRARGALHRHRRHRADYTSARLKTQGSLRADLREASRRASRCRAARGSGPPSGCWAPTSSAVGWPQCGEIDIMENIGREPTTIHGTLHGPGYSGGAGLSGAASSADGGPFADAFHVFAVEWEPDEIRWYVDGRQYFSRNAVGPARRRPLGVRPRLLPAAERGRGRGLARQPRRHDHVPAGDEGRLRARLPPD